MRALDINYVGAIPPPGIKITDIVHPSDRILVVEMGAPVNELWNGVATPVFDLSTRHHGRGNQGFADGHVGPVGPLLADGNYLLNKRHYFELFSDF
jgi:prepilin-type processing-associated H-X9-DG protein